MSKLKEKIRHFKLDWNCTREELLDFFQAVAKVTIRILRTLSSQPTPEKYWTGQWIDVKHTPRPNK